MNTAVLLLFSADRAYKYVNSLFLLSTMESCSIPNSADVDNDLCLSPETLVVLNEFLREQQTQKEKDAVSENWQVSKFTIRNN